MEVEGRPGQSPTLFAWREGFASLWVVSILELKQQISKLSKLQRQKLHTYLVRLGHDTAEWKRAAAKRIDAMKRGKIVTAAELEARVRRG